MIQRRILTLLNHVHMLVASSKTVFSMCTSSVAIRFGESFQLVCSDPFPRHDGYGAEEVAQERESGRRGRVEQMGSKRQDTKTQIR
jgi:hypothetical protein